MKMNTAHHLIERLARYTGVSFQEIDQNRAEEIRSKPFAQARTGRDRAPVYVYDDNWIVKGPFVSANSGEIKRNDLKLINTLRFTYLIGQFEEHLSLPEKHRASLPWDEVLSFNRSGNREYYLAGQNVGDYQNMKTTIKSTRLDKHFEVVDGKLVLPVSDLEKQQKLQPDIAIASLQNLYFRHLLNIGDSGTFNLVVRQDQHAKERLVAGVDLEEQRGLNFKARGTALGCLFKKVFKRHAEIYHQYLAQIVLMEELSELEKNIVDLNDIYRNWSNAVGRSDAEERVISAAGIQERNAFFRALIPDC